MKHFINFDKRRSRSWSGSVLKSIQYATRIVLTFLLVFLPLLNGIPVKTYAAGSIGTADGTYNFSGLQAEDSASSGFAKLGDKFHITNGFAFDPDTGSMYIDYKNNHPVFVDPDNPKLAVFVIKAEGTDTCKTFTFKDLGISPYPGWENLMKIKIFKVDVKDKDGNVTNVVDFNGLKDLTKAEQISELFETTIDYPNVVEIKITFELGITNVYEYNNISFDNITIADVSAVVNSAPTDILLSANTVSENQPSGTTIGTMSATDADAGDTHTYSLVSGDTGNFSIDGNQLKTNGEFDYETKSSYSVKVKATDAGGLSFEKDITISVTNVNEAPTDILLSANTVSENQPSGTAIGTLTTTDPDAGDTHTYAIAGGADAGSFTISGNSLKTNGEFDYDTKDSYSVKISATDAGGLTVEKVFTISVTDANDAPELNNTNPNLTAIDEDTESEIVVSSFLDSSDQDSGALKGIAVTGVTGNGKWQYFESSWKDISSVTDSNALLLKDTDKIKYIPDSKNGEIASLTFRAWDQTSGSAYSKVDASTNGGATAFSTATGTASLTVNAVNDAPNLTSGAYTFTSINKNATSAEVAVSSIATMSDVDNGAASGIAIYETAGNGTWEYSLDGTTWQAFGTVSNSSSLLLRAADKVRYKSSNLGETASFSFRGWDQSSGTPGTTVDTTTNGGTTPFSDNTQTASIEVTKSNEANILTFSIPEQLKPATINAGTIYVEVAGNQNVSNLKPTFTVPDSVQSIKVGTTVQDSGTTANDFSSPVTYVVTAEDGTTKNWVVTVNRVPTHIGLSNSTVAEKKPAGEQVGTLSGTDQDGDAILTYSIHSGDTAEFEIDNNVLKTKAVLDYNVKKQYNLTIRVTDQHGAYFDKNFTIDILDKTPPTATVTMTSNNANDTTKAKVGDTITLEVVTNEDIKAPTVTIAGKAATVTQKADAKTWQATYEVQSADTEGAVPFTLDFQDLVGNAGTQVTAVTTGTAVTLDKTVPTAATVTIKSNNADTTIAKIGDTITLNITTSEDVQKPVVTIAGKAANVTQKTNAKTWEATYDMASGDADGNVAFTLNLNDIVGNAATEVTATTDSSAVAFDGTKPTATTVTMKSNNANPAIAKVGDTITLEIATSEEVQKPVVTIAGKAATITQKGNAKTWEATYEMKSGDQNDGPVEFTIDFIDNVGNAGDQVTAVTTGTAVIFDENAPTATSVSMTSNNTNDTTKAKVGDTITLNIVTNEAITAPTVKLAGKAATVTQKADAKTWQATYEVQSVDTEGAVPFTLDFQDLVGNAAVQVTAVTTGTAVTLDKTAPAASNVTITSSNHNTKKAKVGDVITLSIETSEDVQTPTVKIAGSAANVTQNGDAKTWKAEYTVKSGDPKGDAAFTIDMKDVVGNEGTQVNATTDNSSVKVLSNNAKLSKLNLSKGSLQPTFDSTKTSYTANVGNEVAEIDITPTVEDQLATVKLNNDNTESGSATKVPLTVGANTITIEVTAEDGETKTYTVTITRAAASGGGGGAPTPSQPATQQITVNVESGNNGSTISQTTINRTTENGKVKDEVVLTEKSAKETIDKLKEQKDNTARIVIPDTKDEVAEVNISIPKTALSELKQGKTNLEIQTANAKLTIPNSSLSKFADDIYFRVVPIKDKTEQEQVKERAQKEEVVQEVANGRNVEIVGRPAEIETNLQSQPVTIVLPLKEEDLPKNPVARENQIRNLVIFVEHSDGSKEVLRGKVITNEDGSLGLEFGIDKFSTFTMVYMEGADEYFAELEKQTHKAYISGYPDGSFKPEQNLTRAEMATLLSRILPEQTTEKAVSYTDLDSNHWAYESIQKVAQSGLMGGYPNGDFKPNLTITRAEMAAIVYKWKNMQGNGSNSFKDTTNHWAAGVIAALTEAKMMSGYPDGTFKPNQSLTRAEAVTVINKVLGRGPLTGVTTQKWPDVPATHWASGAIQEASIDHLFEMKDGIEVYKKN